MIKKSPKKTKKSKSYSKLLELDKDISSSNDQLMPAAVSTPDLENSITSKKSKTKRFSPSMKLKNLKGKGALDSKIDEHKDKLESQETANIADEKNHLTLTLNTTDIPETTQQEYSILEKCIKQYEAFFHVYLSRNILNINTVTNQPTCSVIVNLIQEQQIQTPSLDSNTTDPAEPISFVHDDIIDDDSIERQSEIDNMFETLKINSSTRTSRLQHLLNQTMGGSGATTEFSGQKYDGNDSMDSSNSWGEDDNTLDDSGPWVKRTLDQQTEKAIYRIMNLKLNEALRKSVRLAASLLVEMSTFPNYNQNLVIDTTGEFLFFLNVIF